MTASVFATHSVDAASVHVVRVLLPRVFVRRQCYLSRTEAETGRVLLGFLALVAALACDAHASGVVVPDDFPTIQSAIDATADSILIRPGEYEENLVVGRTLVMIGWDDGPPSKKPSIESLTIQLSWADSCKVADLVFWQRVQVSSMPGASHRFERCDLHLGLTQAAYTDYGRLWVTRCWVQGGLTAMTGTAFLDENTFVSGGIYLFCESTAWVRENIVSGPAAAGIEVVGPPLWDGAVTGNQVSGVERGIVIRQIDRLRIESNLVEDCQFEGMLSTPSVNRTEITRNQVRRCKGGGIQIDKADYRDNLVEDCGGVGISGGKTFLRNVVSRVEGDGLVTTPNTSGTPTCIDNVVIGARGAGIRLSTYAELSSNVVGRCGSHGVAGLIVSAHHNTVYRNGGSGFHLTHAPILDHNIVFENGEYGMKFEAGTWYRSSCNDWYGNALGAISGGVPDSTDLDVDPRFCDVDRDSVSLRADSPLLDPVGCGLIGARGAGCSALDAGDPPLRPMDAVTLRLFPNPGQDAIRVEFALPARDRVALSVHDVQGRRVATLAEGERPAGSGTFSWNGPHGERPAPAGIYFVRLSTSKATLVRRLVITP